MNRTTYRRLTGVVMALGYITFIGILLTSVLTSGFFYQFDYNEIHDANIIYLISHGYKMYQSFYDIYGPFLFWLLKPLFVIFGFGFQTMRYARIVMILLFLLNISLIALLVKRIFNKRVALLFIPLFLLDPFTTFVSMQIRTENLAMVFFSFFLLLLYDALEKKSWRLFFISGFIAGLSLITSLKILPGMIGVGGVLLFYLIAQKRGKSLLMFFNGFGVFIFCLFTYFFFQNSLVDMFQQMFLDPARLNNVVPVPTWLGYFYFMNPVIYGHEGKPPTWMYAWLLPVAAFASGYNLFIEHLKEKHIKAKDIMSIMLLFALVLQWISFLLINSIPIQYYIPILWLYVIFTAVLVDTILFKFPFQPAHKTVIIGIFIVALLILTRSAIKGNLNRLSYSTNDLQTMITDILKKIPLDEPVFANIPFRRPIYPLIWNSVKARYIFDRYGPPYKQIEKHQLKYLVWIDDTELSRYDEQTQIYIKNNYEKDPNSSMIWIRKIGAPRAKSPRTY